MSEVTVQNSMGKIDWEMVGKNLVEMEWQMFCKIINELKSSNPGRDRPKCDAIFSTHYISAYLAPCISTGLASRVAGFGGPNLIAQVLNLEEEMSTEFHKGVLFHDTAIACWLSGDEDGYEYLIAMTDEEECRTTGGGHHRGTANLRSDGLTARTITERMQFACNLLNGKIAGNAADYAFMTGDDPITAAKFDGWRQTLDALHQFEMLRIIHDAQVFLGLNYPNYSAAKDNPFVMLRLAKALSHLAQWVESCLTRWQGVGGGTLSNKLKQDKDFGQTLSKCAGGEEQFAGNNPKGAAAVNADLRQLLADLKTAPVGAERQWRLLRILYIVRNSTAHTIESNLDVYQNRALLVALLQVVFVSVFTISQLKAKPMP